MVVIAVGELENKTRRKGIRQLSMRREKLRSVFIFFLFFILTLKQLLIVTGVADCFESYTLINISLKSIGPILKNLKRIINTF